MKAAGRKIRIQRHVEAEEKWEEEEEEREEDKRKEI